MTVDTKVIPALHASLRRSRPSRRSPIKAGPSPTSPQGRNQLVVVVAALVEDENEATVMAAMVESRGEYMPTTPQQLTLTMLPSAIEEQQDESDEYEDGDEGGDIGRV